MERNPEEDPPKTARRLAIRWKVLLLLGIALAALGIFIDWPAPQETSLPDTSSFLTILGGLLGTVGLLAALRKA
jgi:hypothetical protein